jgi:hypothetical protein
MLKRSTVTEGSLCSRADICPEILACPKDRIEKHNSIKINAIASLDCMNFKACIASADSMKTDPGLILRLHSFSLFRFPDGTIRMGMDMRIEQTQKWGLQRKLDLYARCKDFKLFFKALNHV